MTKMELAQRLHEKTGIEKHDTIAIVSALFDDNGIIADALQSDGEVRISGFGVFGKMRVKARAGTTPAGLPYTGSDHFRPTFRAAQGLKDRVFA